MSFTQTPLEDFLLSSGMPFLKAIPLSTCSTWRIGGPADYLVEPSSWEQVAGMLGYAQEHGIPAIVIGKGSNLLFDDAGLHGVVVKIGRKLSKLTITGRSVRAQSGISASRLARAVGLAGLCGLEHIIGIPGTLGGLVAMNGGSQRKAIGDCVETVRVVDYLGNSRSLPREECHFGYRASVFQERELLITEVELKCQRKDPCAIRREMLSILRDRRRKFPRKQPNCGSVFVSGGEMYRQCGPPGRVIEDAGLKGLCVGDVQVSQQHANFVVNLGQASSSDVLELIRVIRQRVHQRTDLWLASEIQYVHPSGTIALASDVFTAVADIAYHNRPTSRPSECGRRIVL